jgi:thiol-disulfide isomerase/thioredoxin
MRGGKGKTKKKLKASGSRSVMGRLLPPVDITSNNQLNELDKRIKMGPVTLVLIYADWCGHCQHFKPMMEKLENLPERSVQTARVREDVFPNSSLASAKIEGYPTLMLVKNNGEVQSFKNKSGEVTNAIPDHTNMNNMSLIVKNAGKEEAVNMLENSSKNISMKTPSAVPISQNNNGNINKSNNINKGNNNNGNINNINNEMESLSPENIVTDRLSEETVETLNNNLVNASNANIKQTTKPAVGGGSKQQGGSLYSQLMLAAKKVAPAATLFLAAESARKTRKSKKSKKKSRKTRRR